MLTQIHNSVFRDNIEGNRLIEVPEQIRRIIDTKEFQRLRNIRQMGLSSFVFPTAEHSRFAHSLGVFALANLVFRQLAERAAPLDIYTPGLRFDAETKLDFTIAALCHDIGHSAFSHVLENILLPAGMRTHEDCTVAIVSQETDIAAKIGEVADRDAVVNLLTKKHGNKALSDLISSTFDVDRCDYVLRDARMAGVEYGRYDLKWLFHALTVETNKQGLPVLLLDGPRGLDALRQFLSARRYLYRQVYYHPTIRAAQILLKAVFTRMQDLGANTSTTNLAPKTLRPLSKGKKLSMGEFLNVTDVEILHMVRRFAEGHRDPVLKFISKLFVSREFPKCVLDSAKLSAPLSESYKISEIGSKNGQGALLPFTDLIQFNAEMTGFIADLLENNSLPKEAAAYLVAFDPVVFLSEPPTDLLFSFRGKVLSLSDVHRDCVGFDIESLTDQFVINRIFAPRQFIADAREYLDRTYGM